MDVNNINHLKDFALKSAMETEVWKEIAEARLEERNEIAQKLKSLEKEYEAALKRLAFYEANG